MGRSVCKSVSLQSVGLAVCQLVSQSPGCRSEGWLLNLSVRSVSGRLVGQSVDRSVSQSPVGRSASQSAQFPVGRSVSLRSVGQIVTHSLSRSVSPPPPSPHHHRSFPLLQRSALGRRRRPIPCPHCLWWPYYAGPPPPPHHPRSFPLLLRSALGRRRRPIFGPIAHGGRITPVLLLLLLLLTTLAPFPSSCAAR